MDQTLLTVLRHNLCTVTDASHTPLGHILGETCHNQGFRNNERFGFHLFFMDLPELR